MATHFGRYELIRPLGRGGMAEVFLAVHRGIGGYQKRLVIKRVLPHMAADERFLRLFFDEAKLHVQLSHGNLVPIFDFGRVGNDYFIAMEYVEGRDLAALLNASRGPLEPSCVVLLGQELAHALGYVHRHGLVHRDVTPRNVLISVDGEVKLADFGVASAAEHATGVSGTLAYMAPEQARGERADPRTDLYALGLILAEAASGRRMREKTTDDEAGLAVAAAATAVAIDGPLSELVKRATDPDPAARFADAAEMAAALDEIGRRLELSRARAAGQLAACVSAIPSGGDKDGVIATSAGGPATYFRDAETRASIVDQILAPAPPPRRRGLRLAGIGATLVAFVALGVSSRSFFHAAVSIPPSTPAPVSPPVARPPAVTSLPAPTVGPSVDGAAPEHMTPRPGPIARPRPVAPHPTIPVAQATLHVRCSPWCVVDIDGQRHGEDGRAHTLRLSAGQHKVSAHRLEDQKDRVVDLEPGGTTEIELMFD